MTILDVGIALLLAAGALVGLRHGLLRLVVGVVSLAAGCLLGLRLAAPVAGWLLGREEGWPLLAGFALVLLAVLVIMALAGRLAARGVQGAGLGWLDRSAGAAAGLLGAALMAGGLLRAVAVAIPATREPLLARSRLAPPLLELSRTLALMAPGLPLPDGEPAGGGDSGRAG